MNINKVRNILYKECLAKIRFYKRELPYIGEMVSSEIMDYSEIGITVFLKEYKKEAFMSYNESSSSSKRIKTIKRQLTENKYNILNVQEVDYTKGFIDVSKRTVNEKEQKSYIKLINKYELIFKILIKTYIWNNNVETKDQVIDFLDKTLWKIDPLDIDKILELYNQNKEIFIEKFNLDTEFNKKFRYNLDKAIPPKKYEIVIKYKINSFSINAIDDIKLGIETIQNRTNIPIKYDTGDIYLSKLVIETKEKNILKNNLDNILSKINKSITQVSEKVSVKLVDYKLNLI